MSNKIHLFHNGSYSNACGKKAYIGFNSVKFKDFLNTSPEKRCKTCENSNFFKEQLAKHESKRPLEKEEFKEPFVKTYKIDDFVNYDTVHINTTETTRIFDENGKMIWVRPPEYDPKDVAFKKIDNYENTPDKYKTTIINRNGESIVCDVYDLIEALKITNSAIQHGFKKVCNPGGRGSKSFEQDMREAISSFEIGILMSKKDVK